MNYLIKIITTSVVLFNLSGCINLGIGEEEYGCSGLPKGVQCKSTRDVYMERHNLATQNFSNIELDDSVVDMVVDSTVESNDSQKFSEIEAKKTLSNKVANSNQSHASNVADFDDHARSIIANNPLVTTQVMLPNNVSQSLSQTYDYRDLYEKPNIVVTVINPYIDMNDTYHGEQVFLSELGKSSFSRTMKDKVVVGATGLTKQSNATTTSRVEAPLWYQSSNRNSQISRQDVTDEPHVIPHLEP